MTAPPKPSVEASTHVYSETRIKTSRQGEDDIIASLRRQGFTGSVTLNFSQGVVGDVLTRRRVPGPQRSV
jgi:hypothetical protein